MESLKITIDPPITEHCKKCGYEAHYSFHAHRCKCPECGEESINHGARPPEKRAIWVFSNHSSYDLCHPSEKQWNYSFYGVPKGKNYSFTSDEELDTSDPIDLAVKLKGIFDKYLYSGSMQKINELVELLDNDETREEQELLRLTERRVELERELFKVSDSIRCYEES